MTTGTAPPSLRAAGWGRRAGLAVAAVLVSLAAAACTSTGPHDAQADVGSRPGAIAWTSCSGLGREFQCARVPVPLDWNRPTGRQIELAVMRRLASRPDARIGSMFVNPGGPGQSGVGLVRDSGAELDTFGGGRFDVVGWDPRGSNDSTHVQCFTSSNEQDQFWKGVSIPSTPAESVAYQHKAEELASRCAKLSGDLLTHISTADTARDLDRLRALVGDPELTYVGLSYGSMIGQTYANLFPDRVRAMMLDGIVDTVAQTTSMEANITSAVSSTDEVLAQFETLCQQAGPGRCALAGHGDTVAQRVTRLFATARRAPIPAHHANPPGVLTYGDLQVSTFAPLRSPLTWPAFAKDLEAAVSGDASNLKTAAEALQTPEALGVGATTSSSISCADAAARVPSSAWTRQIADFTDTSKLWGTVLGWWLWSPCASHWPSPDADRYTGPWNARTRTPILLINARYDPATGYRNAQAAQRRLGNAVLLTLNGYGHPSYQVPSTCVDEARVRYLVDLVTPANGTVCQPDRTPFG
ncbi:alpha/beta fold hydrolase [Streptacidiphilus fuscans]|uniref:Alpha/beta fold hydrolase n=1 Tax=Streptacidiphilus fuscans TaxID=2789292 RepID=A0A931BAX2_9ACTN|nr:alpha/beta hydrolase [Streptacidiphilus fuscans]MBF9072817.1 alpha/beta fold hydrolase [Streptacidiphilus fuscans]